MKPIQVIYYATTPLEAFSRNGVADPIAKNLAVHQPSSFYRCSYPMPPCCSGMGETKFPRMHHPLLFPLPTPQTTQQSAGPASRSIVPFVGEPTSTQQPTKRSFVWKFLIPALLTLIGIPTIPLALVSFGVVTLPFAAGIIAAAVVLALSARTAAKRFRYKPAALPPADRKMAKPAEQSTTIEGKKDRSHDPK